MKLDGRTYLVFGSGLSGISAAELLIRQKKDVILYEGNETITKEMVCEKSPLLKNIEFVSGRLPGDVMAKIDVAVLSPGVPLDNPIVQEMSEMGIKIWGEIELAYACFPGKIIAITGTNGKTTTTSLVGEIMKNYFDDVKVVGNIGIPFTSIVEDTTKDTVVVAEISSFQLETIHDFKPEISAILNISPDHLNRHHTMENYSKIKESVTKSQSLNDICVLNYDDEILTEFAKDLHTNIIWFSSSKRLSEGVCLDGDDIYCSYAGENHLICNINELKLIGVHNYENVMAAVAIALGFSIPIEKIKEVIVKFTAVEHRIEYVTTKRGIRFYNDSKGTNPDAAIQAVKAMKWPTCLIGGGYDKDSDYEPWIKSFDGKIKKLVLLGATKEKIADAAKKCGFTEIAFADDLKEAVSICYKHAAEGDAVLLSPACASWGMFRDYEERGNKFKEFVNKLEE